MLITKNRNSRHLSIPFYLSLILLVMFLFSVSYSSAQDRNEQSYGIKSATKQLLNDSSAPDLIALEDGDTEGTYTSPQYKADFEFNALAPRWKETNLEPDDDGHRHVEVRISSDGAGWTEWMDLEVGRHSHDNKGSSREIVPEVPLMLEGQYFQLRISLHRDTPTDESPQISDVEVNYIDSRNASNVEPLSDTQDNQISSFSGDAGLDIISRSEWGSPDPYGEEYRDTDNYWKPSYSPTEQVFLHHTATASEPSDPEAIVRAIWEYHTNTLGWGDIGYNYILDHEGSIYEGRFGGDNVTAGHVFNYNRGSMGVALIGCFEPDSETCNEVNNGSTEPPSQTAIDSMVDLLSWKTTKFDIDPEASDEFCNGAGDNCDSIPNIAAHRDAPGHGDNACNGELFYDMLPDIREDVATKNDDQPWQFAAKQLTFDEVTLDEESEHITLEFKNNGTETWVNAEDNAFILTTANPSGRSSIFEHSDWIDAQTIVEMEESEVSPGDTATFTFPLSVPDDESFGRYIEGVRLTQEADGDFLNFSSVVVEYIPTYEPIDETYFLSEPTPKTNLLTGDEFGGSLDAEMELTFKSRVEIDGVWYYRTAWDHDRDNDYGIPRNKLVKLEYEPLEEHRFLSQSTTKHNLITDSSLSGTLGAGMRLKFEDRVEVGNTWYYRTAWDESRNNHHGISEDVLTDYEPLDNPRDMYLNATTPKTDLTTGNTTGPSINAGRVVSFDTKVRIDGTWYLRSEWDSSRNNHLGFPLSQVSDLPSYEPLDNPREMRLDVTTPKTNLLTRSTTGSSISTGTVIRFETKVRADGRWYLRSEWDTNRDNHLGFPLSQVNDL